MNENLQENEKNESLKKDNEKKPAKLFLAGSIILSAVLISGSVLYLGKILTEKLDEGFKSGFVLGQQAVPSQIQPNPQQQPEAKAVVEERKGQPFIGNKDAKVTIYEFSDFQCPYCQKFINEAYGQIKSEYIDKGKVKLVFRHFPLPFHANAQKAAEAAECANRQGKFFEYHDLLFKNGKADGAGLNTEDLKKYANQIGLNKGALGMGAEKFNQCLDKGETAEIVKKDAEAAAKAGISGTPSFVINGQKIVGSQPFEVFKQAIEQALK